jgi:hypothetical protein
MYSRSAGIVLYRTRCDGVPGISIRIDSRNAKKYSGAMWKVATESRKAGRTGASKHRFDSIELCCTVFGRPHAAHLDIDDVVDGAGECVERVNRVAAVPGK